MPYRNIFIANQATLRLKNSQLQVDNGDGLHTFPIEDIRSIVIDNPYTTLTVKLISELADEGVCVIIYNEKQYESMQILLGDFVQSDMPVSYEQLTLL